MGKIFDGRSIDAKPTLISPTMATAWISRNLEGNRNVSLKTVSEYARSMKEGTFALNGESIKIANDGKLIDGQHRLMACVQAQTSFWAVVVTGLSADTYLTIDKGRRKTSADTLTQMGIPNAKLLAAAVKFAKMIESGRPDYSATTPGTEGIVDFVEGNPGLRDSASTIAGLKFVRRAMRPSIAAAVHFEFSNRSEADADAFFRALDRGDGLAAHSPILSLRNRLMKENANVKSRAATTPPEIIAWLLNAWNAWRRDRSLTNIKCPVVNEKGDLVFPEIL